MAVKVVRRPELTFWEKLYVPQILCGLKITFRHFFRNLFIHIAHRLGRLKNVRAAVTYQYPEELRPLMSRYRSRHRLTLREDGSPGCVGCMLCETVCPESRRLSVYNIAPESRRRESRAPAKLRHGRYTWPDRRGGRGSGAWYAVSSPSAAHETSVARR